MESRAIDTVFFQLTTQRHMESIEVIVAHREATQERRVVIAPVNRRVVMAVQVPPAVVRAQKNREKQRRWYERHRC